jgi:tetratricopeptide (TPR) repeat protein
VIQLFSLFFLLSGIFIISNSRTRVELCVCFILLSKSTTIGFTEPYLRKFEKVFVLFFLNLRLCSYSQKNLRGYAIAKLYFKIGEYNSAQQWLSLYLSVNEENAHAHKLLGQCYEKRKMTDKAITSYQRSFQLDSKQKNLITESKFFLFILNYIPYQ